MNQDLEHLKRAAKAGGLVLKKYFGETLDIIPKTTAADFKTKADIESEKAILSSLEKHFPKANIRSEESEYLDRGSDYTLVVDPLDGTNNFVLGIPYFSTGIALLKNDVAVVAVVYNPILGQMYWGVKGGGSFLNGEKLSVNQEKNIENATIGCCVSYATTAEQKSFISSQIFMLKPKRFLTLWSALLDFCLLASGRIEALFNILPEMHDFIGGKLILEEAGGKITGLNGESIPDIQDKFIASNGTPIHTVLLSAVKEYEKK